MYNEYLVHYGVKGMKWGVRRERHAANKARKRAEKEAYKRELAAPGSQSKQAISTNRLATKKIKNVAGTILLGRECIGDLVYSGAMLSTAPAILASGGTASLAAGFISGGIATGAVGIAAGVGAYKTYKRTRSIGTSMRLRDNPNDPKAKAKAAEITRERAPKEQKRRAKVEQKNKKRAIKQLRKDPGGRAAYDSTKRIAKQLGKDVDVDIDDLGRVTSMYVK